MGKYGNREMFYQSDLNNLKAFLYNRTKSFIIKINEQRPE